MIYECLYCGELSDNNCECPECGGDDQREYDKTEEVD